MKKRKCLALILTFAMVIGMMPSFAIAASAEESHTHTEDCYAKAGDLLCTIPESEGHIHTEACVCPGGENICGLEETEGHTHDESCYDYIEDEDSEDEEVATPSNAQKRKLVCSLNEQEGHAHTADCVCPGGEYICGLKENEGHTHSEDCYAQGGELICGEEDATTFSSDQDYADIKAILTQDDSISFNPDTQTFLIIDVDAVQSEHLASLNIYQAEERIKEHELTFDVSIDDTPVGRDQTYYLISQKDNKIERATVSDTFKMAANSGKVAVFILDKGKTYSVSYNISDCYYTKASWSDENGNTYNGNGFTCRPMNGKTITEYNGTAEDDPAIASFSFEWDLSNYLDIEIWMADTIRKQMENPGWGFPDNATGYVNFLIELRDADGNISRLPMTYFNNYGNDNLYNVMHEDGVVSIPLSIYDDNAADGSPYGEFDIYIPFGYDYRITLLSYSVDTLGGYAYYYNQEHTPDTDDFCVTDKSLTGQDEWGSFLEFTFMPMNKEIRIEKTVEGNEPQNAEYEFQVTELVPSFVDKYNDAGYQNGYEKTDDLYQTLGDYPYELYDAKTGNRIDDGMLKTDMEGCFSMRADQYAVFKTWGLPKDFDDYTGGGFHVKGIYDAFSKDISKESRYIVNEVESPDCTTTITHTHNGIETKVNGKRVEEVYGGDKLLYQNVFTGNPTGSTGSLTISKKVIGTGTPDADTLFEFTVTKDGAAAVGQYSVDGGATQTIPADGKISIKAGQSAVLTGLEPGEYTVTETSPTQANYKSTSFSVNNGEVQNGLSATVTVTGAAAETTGGWSKKDGMPVQDTDGYFNYTITSDQIDADGKITVDCDLLAEYMEAQMQEGLNWSPRNFKVKFVNHTGAPIQYQDYRFDTVNWIPVGQTYTPSNTPAMDNQFGYGWGDVWQQVYPFVAGQTETAGSLDVKGFDGNNIRLAISPLRCINPAVISYFDSNPGTGTLTGNSSTNGASYITLKQMNALPELIKKAFTFKNWEGTEISLTADENRTYADFICAFYGVNSLNELTIAQKYNVLGTGGKGSPVLSESKYKGQSAITTYYSIVAPTTNRYIPSADLNDNTLNYFKTWGFGMVSDTDGYDYQPNFFLMENDPEVLKMAYDFLYSRCIRFSLDSNDRPVSTSIDNSATSNDGVGGIKDYMDRTDAATANVLKTMNNGAAIADGGGITLDNVKGYIEVPNAWNQFRAYDFGFKLIFKADAKQPAAASVAFTNTYENNESVPGEKVGNLTVSKTISGNGASSTKAFTFTVTLTDKNGQAVSGTFGDAVFDKNGQHIFTLKAGENKTISSIPTGTKYAVAESDNSGYTVTVNNTADVAATGTIMAGETAVAAFNNYKSGGGGGGGGETSDPSPAKVNLTATKTLDGKAPSGSAFSFVLKDKDGNIVQTKNNQEGSIAFDSLSFSAAGTYAYYIAEQAGTDANINYDATSYKVTITVTRSGDYKAAVNYEKNGQAYDGIPVFVNTTKSDDSDKPNTPATPDKPTKPTDPDTPDEPNKPTKPTDPAQPIDPVPQTGDETDIGMWLTLMLCSFVALVGVCVYERKRRYSGRHVRR